MDLSWPLTSNHLTYLRANTLASESASLMPRRMESCRSAMCFSSVCVPQACTSWFSSSHACRLTVLDLEFMWLVTMGMSRFVWTYWKTGHTHKHKRIAGNIWMFEFLVYGRRRFLCFHCINKTLIFLKNYQTKTIHTAKKLTWVQFSSKMIYSFKLVAILQVQNSNTVASLYSEWSIITRLLFVH